MDRMPELWQTSPKVHNAAYLDILPRMLSTWTFQQIYDEVVKWGIEDDDDKIITTRALCLIRDQRRKHSPHYTN